MSEPSWDRIKEVFAEVREHDPSERERRVKALCGDDEPLAERVRSLLVAEDAGVGDLEAPTASDLDVSRLARVTAGTEDDGEKPGSRIGPYKLLQVIGEGGFGIVYMAEQHEPIRRRVALKVIKPGMDSKQVIARFEAERQALAMMDHPNIAKVFEAGTTPRGRPYFAMELVRGIPITDYCDEERLDLRERLALFRDVCSAVHHAHKCGIIHRDLKPSNVMVTLHDGRPVPKVIDFGVAKATQRSLTEKTLFTEYNQFIGTPLYMSPEQAAYEGLDVDERSDVYSLGVLLYELLTGTTPHDSAAMKRAVYFEVLRVLKEEEPPKPSTRVQTMGRASLTHAKHRRADPDALRKLLRGDLDWIVMKALEKDRRRRYDSASHFADDIGRYFEARPINARPPSRLYRARKFAHRRRGPLAAAVFVGLAVAGDVAYVSWQRSHMAVGAAGAGLLGSQPTALVTSSDEQECFTEGVPSADGTRLVYGDYCNRGGVWLYDIESGETSQLVADDYHESFAWSPDGDRLATAPWGADSPELLVVSARTGAIETPPALRGLPLAPMAWSPDGERIAGVRFESDETRSLVVLDVATGGQTVLAHPVRKWQTSLSFSPDSRFLTFSRGPAEAEDLYVIDLVTDERWPLVTGRETEEHALWSPDGGTIVYQDPAGVWALHVEQGRPAGRARLVRREPHRGIAWTEHGYYYAQQNTVSRVLRGAIDPETGEQVGPWEPYPLVGSDLSWLRLAWSPDRSRSAVAGCCDGLLHVSDGRTTTAIPLGPELAPVDLWWSGDGEDVLFYATPNRLRDPTDRVVHAVNVASGTVRELFPPLSSEQAGHIHVAPDGTRMVFMRSDSELVVSELGSPDGTVVAGANEHGLLNWLYRQPRFSPDGRRVAFTRATREGRFTLWVVSADGADETLVATAEEGARIFGPVWHPGGSRIAFVEQRLQRPSTVWVASADGGRKMRVGDVGEGLMGGRNQELLAWSADGGSLLLRETVGRNELWVTRDILGASDRTED